MPNTQFQAVDANGSPLSGGKVFTYSAGTTTPLATYTDSTGSVQNANPVILNTLGAASIWLSQAAYKVVVQNAAGAVEWSQDNVAGGNYVVNIPNLTTGVAYAMSYCTTPSAPDETCINNAFAQGGVSTVQVAGNLTINNPVVIGANHTVRLMPGVYTMGNNGKFALSGTGSQLYCPAGPDATIITVPQTYAVTDGVIALTSGEPAGHVEGCQIQFSQPDTSNRTSLVHYSAAGIYTATGANRARILHNKIIAAWNAVALGSTGGALIDDLQMNSFNHGISIDGAADTDRLNNVHSWPFGLTSNQITAFENSASIGLFIGRCDDCEISNGLFLNGQAMQFFQGATGPPFGNIVNTGFDTFSGIIMSAGNMAVSSSYFNVGCSTCIGVSMTGGNLTMSAVTFNLASANTEISMVNGGTLQIAGSQFLMSSLPTNGQNAAILVNGSGPDLRISSSYFNSGSVDVISALAENGSFMTLVGNRFFRSSNTIFVQPTISYAGASAARGTVSDCTNNDIGTGSGTFVAISANNWIFVHDNSLLGWPITLPATHTEVISHDNN